MEEHANWLTLQVPLGERTYTIYIGAGIYRQIGALIKPLQPSRLVVLTHPHLAKRYLTPISGMLEEQIAPLHVLLVPSGERSKSWRVVGRVLREMARLALDRRCVVLALGGGVIGDLAGFVAACYLRGVRYVQLPTTLLAQVDSSVGGKTGVNLPEGKNLVGAFHQPSLVVIDTDVLRSLPVRHFRAGLAEVLKYGAIADENLWHYVLELADELRHAQTEKLAEIVHRCCQIKAEIVAQDETEQGLRAVLNFGHTVGHALEAATGYRRLLHGEAVSIGMVSAALVGEVVGVTPAGTSQTIAEALRLVGLPVALPADVTDEQLLPLIGRDKKAREGKMRFVLLNRIGQATLPIVVNEKEVLHALQLHRQRFGVG